MLKNRLFSALRAEILRENMRKTDHASKSSRTELYIHLPIPSMNGVRKRNI